MKSQCRQRHVLIPDWNSQVLACDVCGYDEEKLQKKDTQQNKTKQKTIQQKNS